MSLHVGDSARRGRDQSSDRRRSARGSSPSLLDAVRMPSPPAGFSYDDDAPRRERPVSYRVGSPTEESSYYSDPRRKSVERLSSSASSSRGNKDIVETAQDVLRRGADAFLPAKYASKLRETEDEKAMKKERKKEKLEDDLAYGTAVVSVPAPPPGKYQSPTSSSSRVHYSMPGEWEDDKERLRYPRVDTSYAPSLPERPGKRDSYGRDPRASGARIMTAEPGLTPGFGGRREHSPLPPGRTSSLTVNTGHHSASLSNAPPSPLLESYYGTYQSMSPMPSPLLLAQESPRNSDLIEPLSPSLSDGESNNGEKKRRRARFNDPVDDAARLAKALKGDHSPPDTEPLIEILPGMTHDQIMELRVEYKRLVKTGAERKGVNIAKHIRARLKDEDPTLMKACYTVALGKWESEAYWANFWYHGDKTRRELLIESLMGRSNYEIAQIKEAFSDKKYRDSLTLCMKTELKEDKFKRAVLMVLDEKRMEDMDEYGRPRAVDRELVQDDVEALYKAVRSDRGGESAMIQIVVSRSPSHMKEVLRLYEKVVGSNFARDALKKSGNLVGELLAHILNGIINKPVRDALLLHHALTASRKDHLRRELLISRLVRFHWDRHHMAAIKRAYRERYGEELSEAVKEGTSGEWGLFCEQLVVTRIPDDVKSFEKVDAVREIRRSEDGERERDREERLREREREMDRESEKEREREGRHRSRKEERDDKDRKEKKERRREKKKDRGEDLLVVKDSKHRDRSRSRERSRSQRRE